MADCDLVLEGGGVKGSGLVGALSVLAHYSDPYAFRRIAGTSAGAIVASLVASGFKVDDVKQVMLDLDFAKFEDQSPVFRHFKEFGEGFGLIFREGMFKGDFLHDWVQSTLGSAGVRTWGDLRQHDAGSALPPEQRYKLVVVVSDISRGRMLRIPWDCRELLGVDPDDQPVADAIRASASDPVFLPPLRHESGPSAQRRAWRDSLR